MMRPPGLTREEVAARVAVDLPDGSYVNLGIGIPTLVSNHVPAGREIVYHSENGILGVGPPPEPGREDPELANASKELVTVVPGAAFFHHADSFMMMRGGHIDITVLGAFQVSGRGDLANWSTGDPTRAPAVGGAMDLAVGARRVLVAMMHTARDGTPKLVDRCTLPLTATSVVDRVYTDLAVLDVGSDGFVVRELADGVSRDALQAVTAAPLRFPPKVGLLRGAGRR